MLLFPLALKFLGIEQTLKTVSNILLSLQSHPTLGISGSGGSGTRNPKSKLARRQSAESRQRRQPLSAACRCWAGDGIRFLYFCSAPELCPRRSFSFNFKATINIDPIRTNPTDTIAQLVSDNPARSLIIENAAAPQLHICC